MKSVAEIDSFITLLCVACENPEIYARLEKILSLPDAQRKSLLGILLSDMRKAQAPDDFIAAISCLIDTTVAEKAYEAIFKESLQKSSNNPVVR